MWNCITYHSWNGEKGFIKRALIGYLISGVLMVMWPTDTGVTGSASAGVTGNALPPEHRLGSKQRTGPERLGAEMRVPFREWVFDSLAPTDNNIDNDNILRTMWVMLHEGWLGNGLIIRYAQYYNTIYWLDSHSSVEQEGIPTSPAFLIVPETNKRTMKWRLPGVVWWHQGSRMALVFGCKPTARKCTRVRFVTLFWLRRR